MVEREVRMETYSGGYMWVWMSTTLDFWDAILRFWEVFEPWECFLEIEEVVRSLRDEGKYNNIRYVVITAQRCVS